MARMGIQKDVDIMGVQRGEHKDGPDICSKYVFKIPGGTNPDGSTLWGWNDAGAAYCASCGCRDIDHVVLRDFTEEGLKADREKERQERMKPAVPVRTRADVLREADPTAANPGPRPVFDHSAPQTDPLEAAARLGMYELEPGVPDPLAMNAYQDAARQESALKTARATKMVENTTAAVTAKMVDAAPAPATGEEEAGEDETERFKAEVEKMVKEQVAARPPSAAPACSLAALT